MHSHQDAIQTKLADTKVYLDKLQQEIGRTLEKIGSREKYINNQVCVCVCVFQFDVAVLLRAKFRNATKNRSTVKECNKLIFSNISKLSTYPLSHFFPSSLPLLQLESSIAEFRTSQDRLAEIRERYKNGSSSVNDLARELAQVILPLCPGPNDTSLINAISISPLSHSPALFPMRFTYIMYPTLPVASTNISTVSRT